MITNYIIANHFSLVPLVLSRRDEAVSKDRNLISPLALWLLSARTLYLDNHRCSKTSYCCNLLLMNSLALVFTQIRDFQNSNRKLKYNINNNKSSFHQLLINKYYYADYLKRVSNLLCELSLFRYWYVHQKNILRWAMLYMYGLECRVKQGGLTSPKLFNLYINKLIRKFRNIYVGCHIDGVSWK